MKNFGTLYYYELKKLLKRPLSWAAVLGLTFFCVYGIIQTGAALYGEDLPVPDENGEESGKYIFISGKELYDRYVEYAGRLNGRAIDDELIREMQENLPRGTSLQMTWYFETEDETYARLYYMLEGPLDPMTATAEEFYDWVWEVAQANWNTFDLTDGEREYWMEQYSKVQKPYVYQAPWAGVNRAFDSMHTLFIFLPLMAAICVCTLFSRDRRERMEPLVYAARRSRAPLFCAKVLAGATVTAGAAVLAVGAMTAAFLLIWGTDGLDAPIQNFRTYCLRPITVGQMFLPILFLLVLFTLLYGGLAMLVSMATHSSLAALACPVVVSYFMNLARVQSPQSARGLSDFFRYHLMGDTGVINLHLVKVLGVYLDNFQAGTILYLSASMILLVLCWPFWRRSAENG